VVCTCCQGACDGTFRVLGHPVCFDCSVHESYESIMAIIREKLNVNVDTWAVAGATQP
jgi:hypothetical protein